MKLPLSGGPGRPSSPQTHPVLDAAVLARHGVALEDACGNEPVTASAIEDLAAELGVDESRLWAALAVTTELEVAREWEVQLAVCVGGCQGWGALACLETLAELRRRRADEGKQLFDIVPRRCLDKCSRPPAVAIHTRDGTAFIPEASPASLAEAVEAACDG